MLLDGFARQDECIKNLSILSPSPLIIIDNNRNVELKRVHKYYKIDMKCTIFLIETINIQVNKMNSTFCLETKPLVSIQFWVAESESRIRFFPSRQNFAVLPISWLPGLKISFSSFSKKLWEISKI